MIFEEMLQDERTEGKSEGKIESKIEDILDFLGSIGTIPEDLKVTITSQTNLDVLKRWLKLAAKATTINDFIKEM